MLTEELAIEFSVYQNAPKFRDPKPKLVGQFGGMFQLGWAGELCSKTDSSSRNL